MGEQNRQVRHRRGHELVASKVHAAQVFSGEKFFDFIHVLRVGRIAGGQGYLKGNPLERYFRDLRSAPLHTLKRDEVLEMIAATELGFA